VKLFWRAHSWWLYLPVTSSFKNGSRLKEAPPAILRWALNMSSGSGWAHLWLGFGFYSFGSSFTLLCRQLTPPGKFSSPLKQDELFCLKIFLGEIRGIRK
jgi:hypothetical protein